MAICRQLARTLSRANSFPLHKILDDFGHGKKGFQRVFQRPGNFCSTSAIAAPATIRPRASDLRTKEADHPDSRLPLSALSFRSSSQAASQEDSDIVTEYFIPVTKSAIVRYLLEEHNFLNSNEKTKFEQLAASLNDIISNRYVGTLDELKRLFDPLNPTKSLVSSRSIILRDRIDQEFWLLQKLAIVFEKANFFEIPKHVIEAIGQPHQNQGLTIAVDTNRYAVLRLWALGQEMTYPPMPWYEETFRLIAGRWFPHLRLPPRQPRRYLRRLVAAIRMRSDATLQLKVFRDVPLKQLTVILPDGQLHPSLVDQMVIGGSATVTVLGALSQYVCYMGGNPAIWPLVTAYVSGLILAHRWGVYMKKRARYTADAARTQFYKTVASNHSLLEALVNRAFAETFKEALLVYTFLLTQRPPSVHSKRSHQHEASELGGLTQPLLEKSIETWAKRVFGVCVQFDAEEAIRFLQSIGLLRRQEDGILHVEPLDSALRLLPPSHRHLLEASEETDIIEGYDKDIIYDDILREDKIISRHGWT